jgi:hypothetical protein
MKQQAPDITRLVRNLVRLNGRDSTTFQASVLEDGSIAVHNATTAVYYVQDGWISKFNRHLHLGFFDAPAHAATPHAMGTSERA